MRFVETPLAGAFVVDIEAREDNRGMFARAFCRDEFARSGLAPEIAQANLAVTLIAGTVRGMHFQDASAPEGKYVRCTSGRILDVIVDLRPESPTFLNHYRVELTRENRRALYVPPRFAHGYQTLQDDTEILYFASSAYAPASEGGLRYNDPRLGISWPLEVTLVSDRDADFPLLSDAEMEIRRRMTV